MKALLANDVSTPRQSGYPIRIGYGRGLAPALLRVSANKQGRAAAHPPRQSGYPIRTGYGRGLAPALLLFPGSCVPASFFLVRVSLAGFSLYSPLNALTIRGGTIIAQPVVAT